MKTKDILKRFVAPLTKNKKGVLGLDTAQAFVIGILSIVIVAVATLITLNALQGTSVASASTSNIINNASAGIEELFTNATTWFTLIAVVIIILIIAVVIVVVQRFGGAAAGRGAAGL